MEKYDITKPIKLPVGMHKLNDDAGISFQLNRLVNLTAATLRLLVKLALQLKTQANFTAFLKIVLTRS